MQFLWCRAKGPSIPIANILLYIDLLSIISRTYVSLWPRGQGKRVFCSGLTHGRYEAFERQQSATPALSHVFCTGGGLGVKPCRSFTWPSSTNHCLPVHGIRKPTALSSTFSCIGDPASILSNASFGFLESPRGCVIRTSSYHRSFRREEGKFYPSLPLQCISSPTWPTQHHRSVGLYGAASNRINGKPPAVLPSPSPFPAALLHLPFKAGDEHPTRSDGERVESSSEGDTSVYSLQSQRQDRKAPGGTGGTVLPSGAYTGRLSRLPCSPSVDLYLLGAPARLFRAKSVVVRAHSILRQPGLPIVRSRWCEGEEETAQLSRASGRQRPSSEGHDDGCEHDCVNLPCDVSLDFLVRKGDHYPGKKRYGEVASLFQPSRNYGKPFWPSKALDVAKEYNRQMDRAGTPEKKVPEEVKYDTIFCDEKGYIMRICENGLPYDGSEEPEKGCTTWELYKLRKQRQVEKPAHRFIVSAPAGFVKTSGLKVGDRHPAFNDETMQRVFNNHFAFPRKYREPLLLPDGRVVP